MTQYYVINFVAQIVPALAIERTFSWLLCPFDMPPPFFFFLSASLFADTTVYSRFILYISCLDLESVISPRNPGSLYWRMALETKISVLDVPVVTGCHCFRPTQQAELGKYIFINLYVHTC